jgi:hypothetical protein
MEQEHAARKIKLKRKKTTGGGEESQFPAADPLRPQLGAFRKQFVSVKEFLP